MAVSQLVNGGLLLTTCMSGDDPPSLQVLPPLLVVAVFVCLMSFLTKNFTPSG